MNRLASLVCLGITLLVGGCAGVQTQSEGQAVLGLLAQYRDISALAPEEQKREYQTALANFQREPDVAHRLQLALMLSLPRTPWRDDGRVLQLVESIVENPASEGSPYRDFALLLQKMASERLRALRDEQHKAEVARGKMQNTLIEERRRAEDLQRKLDALLAIDRKPRARTPPQ